MPRGRKPGTKFPNGYAKKVIQEDKEQPEVTNCDQIETPVAA